MDAVFGEGKNIECSCIRSLSQDLPGHSGNGKDAYQMEDYSEQVALVGRGEHEQDDDESTIAPPPLPRKHSIEDGLSQKPFTSSLRSLGHHTRGSYTSLPDEDD